MKLEVLCHRNHQEEHLHTHGAVSCLFNTFNNTLCIDHVVWSQRGIITECNKTKQQALKLDKNDQTTADVPVTHRVALDHYIVVKSQIKANHHYQD